MKTARVSRIDYSAGIPRPRGCKKANILERIIRRSLDAYLGIQIPRPMKPLEMGQCFHSLAFETGVPTDFPNIGGALPYGQVAMIIETALGVPGSDRRSCLECEKELPVIFKYSRVAGNDTSNLWIKEYFIVCPECLTTRDTREIIRSYGDCL